MDILISNQMVYVFTSHSRLGEATLGYFCPDGSVGTFSEAYDLVKLFKEQGLVVRERRLPTQVLPTLAELVNV